jgi:NADH-quinone oxidoreductase subunit J
MQLQAEFLAIVLVLVYVGAVMVLFLFVVMMLDVSFAELRSGFLKVLPVGLLVGFILLFELIFVVGAWVTAPQLASDAPMPPPSEVSNTKALGDLLYTDYVYLFQACGMILLVAMIGAIVLTLRQREGVRRQSIGKQVSRKVSDTIEVKKVPSRSGV